MDCSECKGLIGQTIIDAEVDGHGIVLTLNNGTVFHYFASDAGYSTYVIYEIGKDDEQDG